MVQKIRAAELKKKLAQGEVVLIDVREPFEHQTECIEGACLIPLGDISCSKLPQTDKPLVIHCRSGKRSEEACKKLLSENPSLDIYNLEGGILAWKALGCQVVCPESASIPIDRQVQIAVGAIVLAGVLLGSFVTPWFYLLSGFAGAGLLQAGITGWCGMAKLLAMMPWNRRR